MAPSFSPATGIGSLVGKVILITGGNSGIGRETISQLAKHSPSKIYLAARSETKAYEAIKWVQSGLKEQCEIEWLPLDTASLPSVKSAADHVKTNTNRLDILILNAGIMAHPAAKSATGHDLQLETNHFGHFLLTKLLMPTLQKTAREVPNADVRIITVASDASDMAPAFETIMDNEKLCAAGPWTRYGASKAANIMFASELARRYPNLTSVSLHPGVIKTQLWQHDDASNSFIKYWMMLIGRFVYVDVKTGALNSLYLSAGAKKNELRNGGFYVPVGKLKADNKYASNLGNAKKFWEWTERELETAGY